MKKKRSNKSIKRKKVMNKLVNRRVENINLVIEKRYKILIVFIVILFACLGIFAV